MSSILFFFLVLTLLIVLPVSNVSSQPLDKRPAVILTFDDDWPGQYWHVRPLLEKYGANATFFISCTAINDIVREDSEGQMMSWERIKGLAEAGFDIESHGMTHADLTKIRLPQAEEEVRDSKECILANVPSLKENHKDIKIYGNAFARGGDNKDIVDLVAKYYDFARSGYSNTTYLGCDGWYVQERGEPADCRVLTDNGTVKTAHRYQLFASSHNNLDRAYQHDTPVILEDFKHFLNNSIRFDDNGTLTGLPILTYHNVAYLNQTQPRWHNSTTLPETLEAELQYMNQTGIRMLSMADLIFDNATQKFHIREGV